MKPLSLACSVLTPCVSLCVRVFERERVRVCVCLICVLSLGGLAVKYLTLSLWRRTLISLIVLFDDSNTGLIGKWLPLTIDT